MRSSRWRRVLLWLLVAFPAGLGLALLGRVLAAARLAASTRIPVRSGIAELRPVELGGLPQWISIRGRDRSKPLLLFLHGGPGFPQLPFVRNNALLENDFVVVQWDERGAGKSYQPDIPAGTMNLTQLVADAHQLVQMLRTSFGGQRIFLCAHSYGTLMGALLVAQHPEDFRAYVGISQIGDMMRAEALLYEFGLGYARKHGPADAARALENLGPPPHHDKEQLELVEKWTHRFAKQLYPQTRPVDLLPRSFISPQYSLADCVRLLRGAAFSSKNLWREAYQTNLFQRVTRLEVPVFFLAGRHDYSVTATVAHEYFDALEAPLGKRFIWFEKSSHYPNFEEPQKFRDVMVTIVRPAGVRPAPNQPPGASP